MIHTEATIQLGKPPREVFRFLDDEDNAPKWNSRAVEMKRTSPGEKRVGAKLHYVYRDAGRQRAVDGRVTAYEKDRKLAMNFSDPMMDISVVFELSPASGGTEVKHFIEIEPKTFLVKLMTPIIRAATKKGLQNDLQRLKALLESRSDRDADTQS